MKKPRAASSMTVTVCEHGTLWLALCDETGRLFAYGTLDTPGSLDLVDEIHAGLQAALKGLAKPCEGHA